MKELIIGIILVLCVSLTAADKDEFDITEPIEPVAPSVQSSNKKTVKKSEKKVDQAEDIDKSMDLYVFDTHIVFEDNTTLKGMISIPESSLKVKHTKNGFVFEKRIEWRNVKTVKLSEWRPRESKKNKNSKLKAFYFYPESYEIIMKKGQKYKYKNNIEYFNKLVLTNIDGSTHLYSYFIDYWKITGEKSGYWQNTRSSYFYAPVNKPHKKSIKIINFK